MLVNKSGQDDSNKFQATDQKWSYTELKSDQTKLNLPAYGEVNGLLNPALVEVYGLSSTQGSSTGAGGAGGNTGGDTNTQTYARPGIGFKLPSTDSESSKATLITPGLA